MWWILSITLSHWLILISSTLISSLCLQLASEKLWSDLKLRWKNSNFNLYIKKNQGWEFAHQFSEPISRFLRKNELMSNLLKKNKRFAHSLIFGEQPERFAHSLSFLVSYLSDSLISLFKNFFKNLQKMSKKTYNKIWF